MKSSIVVLIVCLGAASALFFGSKSNPDWNELKVTWGPNPLSSEYFVDQPLTVADAKKAGYQQVSSGCGGKFLGQRFTKDKDVGLVLIYDVQGTIAGVQMAIPASMITDAHYKFSAQKMYNRDTIGGTDVYVLTAYFVDPKTICQSGRTAQSLKAQGTGTGFWLQNGTDPIRDSFSVPLTEAEAIGTKWIQGACFPTMGIHYWYDNRLDSNCDTFFPVFLLYNNGKLTGLGWVAFGKFEYTKRTEFPPYAAIASFLKPVPTCMAQTYADVNGFTTMHLYLSGSPLALLC